MKTADIFCLPHNPIILVIICNYTHSVSGSLTAQLGAGNILGTLQVHNITVILKVVKFAAPVRTKYQKVYLILDDIAELLPLVLLDDDLICKPVRRTFSILFRRLSRTFSLPRSIS